MSGRQGFQVVSETEVPEAPKPDTQPIWNMLVFLHNAITRGVAAGISHLVTILGVFSAWWMWMSVMPNPSTLQLIALGGYATFLLFVEFVRRKV